MKFGKFELDIIRESEFSLDGGAMFGVVPKTLWSKSSQTDELNRIKLSCNLLLIRSDKFCLLVETGMGTRWSDQERQRYCLETKVDWNNIVKDFNLTNDDITDVVISHLHFDHCGGATNYIQEKLQPTFKNARYHIQKKEWEFSKKANARAKASYRPDDYMPLLNNGNLNLIEGDTQIYDGINLAVTGGHTLAHQVITFESEGQKGIFLADIMPTASHVNPAWVMGYDHYPLASCDYKDEILNKAFKEKYLVVFDHEISIPWGYIDKDSKGKFLFIPLTN